MVGRAAGGERRGDRELEEQLVGPIGQGRGIDRLPISLLQGAEALPARLDQHGASLVRPARPQQVEADGCLAKGLHVLKPLRIGGPTRRQLQEVAPPPVRRGLQDQAGEFVGDGEVELARIREISPLQDGVAAGLERMRLEQISRGIAVAAQHLHAQQLVVGASTSGRTSAAAPTGVAPTSPEPGEGPLTPAPGPCGIRPGWRATAGARRPGSCWAEWSEGTAPRRRPDEARARHRSSPGAGRRCAREGAPHRSARMSSTARWPAPCRGDRARPRSRGRGAIAGRREAAARRRATGCSPH